MSDRILREPEVAQKDGNLSRSTRWRLERDGRYPRRKKIGLNAVGWKESEIEEWIKDPEGWVNRADQAVA